MGIKRRVLREGDYHMTLAEIGKELGVSRQTVSVIEKQALFKIKQKMEGWKSYGEFNDGEGDFCNGCDDLLGSGWLD